jgi:hypothetical protein
VLNEEILKWILSCRDFYLSGIAARFILYSLNESNSDLVHAIGKAIYSIVQLLNLDDDIFSPQTTKDFSHVLYLLCKLLQILNKILEITNEQYEIGFDICLGLLVYSFPTNKNILSQLNKSGLWSMPITFNLQYLYNLISSSNICQLLIQQNSQVNLLKHFWKLRINVETVSLIFQICSFWL